MSPYRIGLDLGGTKIEVIVLSPQGSEVLRERLPTPQGQYGPILNTIALLVDRARSAILRAGGDPLQATVGMGIPGSLSHLDNRVRGANSQALNGQRLQEDLQTKLGQPVRIENDANCLAMSEAVDGAGAEALSVFAVILGTGVGGGLVHQGRIISGHNRQGGEWGHNRLAVAQDDQRGGDANNVLRCWCGRRDCNEVWLSGPALAQDHARRHRLANVLSAHDIAKAADAGDEAAKITLEAYCRRLAFALAQVINVFDPEVIVIGGGVSNIGRVFERVPKLWSEHQFTAGCTTRLVPSQHGDSSGVRGAAWLWN
jgi:fructokinase